jgi:hypothetical protein
MTVPHTNAASYEVGYGRPPRRTQFQKGRSGNPGGRPRRPPAERLNALALYEAYRTMIVMEDGRAVPVSAIQAVLRSQPGGRRLGNPGERSALQGSPRRMRRGRSIRGAGGRHARVPAQLAQERKN